MFLFRSGSHLCVDPFQVFSLLWRWRPPYCCKPYSGCLSPLFQTHCGLCAPLIHCFPGKAATTSCPRMTAVSSPQCHVASFSSSGPFLTHFIGHSPLSLSLGQISHHMLHATDIWTLITYLPVSCLLLPIH